MPELAPKARRFLATLQALVKADDRQQIAGMIRYPLNVYSAKRHRRISNPGAFVSGYPVLFSPAVKKAIEQQSPECLFGNWQGVMIGNGEVWFEEGPDGTIKIKTLNQ